MSRSLIWRWFGKVNEGDQPNAKCKVHESRDKQYTLGMAKGTISSIRYHLQYKKNGRNSVPIDDLEEKGNTEVTDSEEETGDECSSKGAIGTQSTSQPHILAIKINLF